MSVSVTESVMEDVPLSNETGLRHSPLVSGSKPLRLLTILPSGRYEDDIECLLNHADLDLAIPPAYETISYVWGDPRCTDRLLVNGNIVNVPASSVAALRRMRLHDASRVVWLDAICINQQDEHERSQQVSMMGDIYRLGVGDLIYLGEENIDRALVSVGTILEEANTTPNSFTQMRSDVGAWQYDNVGISAQFDAEALFKLYSLAWFQRLWVLQEAALASKNTCYCGSTVVELVQLTRVAAWLIYKYYFVDADLRLQCSYAADMNDLIDETYGYHRSRSGHPASVLYLLDLAQQRLSSIAADKVYGILGLIAQNEGQSQIRIEPDYSKSIAEIYREAAWGVIELSGDLQILDYVRHWTRHGEMERDDFASWIPKWHRSKDLEEHSNFMSLSFDACLGRKAIVHSHSEPANSEILTVSGIYVCTITYTSERIKCDEAIRTTHLNAVLNEAEAQLKDQDGLSPEELESALAITVCAGVDSSYQPAGQDTVQGYRNFRDHAREGRPRLPSISEYDKTQDGGETTATHPSHFAEAMYNACMNRKFFTTSQGHRFGLGPHFLRVGDIIVVLYGLRWPAVLRRVAGDENKGEAEFIFLGTAYCYGIMQGGAVTEHDGMDGSTPDVFHIR